VHREFMFLFGEICPACDRDRLWEPD
jgi:hypothetical protein